MADYIANNVFSYVALQASIRIMQQENSVAWPTIVIAGEKASEICWEIMLSNDNSFKLKLFYIKELPPDMWLLCDEVNKICMVGNPW